jgi:hypothetical protein
MRSVSFSLRAAVLALVCGGLLADGPAAVETAPEEGPSEVQSPAVESRTLLNSRAELWRSKRLAKASIVEPNQLGGFEKGMIWFETKGMRQIFNFNYRGLYPQFATLSTGSGFAPGIRYLRPRLGGSPVDLQTSAALSVRGYRSANIQFGRIQQKGQALSLEPVGLAPAGQFDESQPKRSGFYAFGDITYRYFPQEDFFGVGPGSLQTNRSDYVLEDMSYDAVAGWQVNRWLSTGLRVGYLQLNIDPGTDRRFPDTHSLFGESSAPGLAIQPDFLTINGAVMLDYRDRPGNPHKGGMVGLYLSRFDDRVNHGFEFQRLALDVRQFVPLGSEQRRLALRLFGSADDPDRGAHVPFYLMQTLGGSDMLRGFREFRYRDLRTLYLSAEYRWDASPAIELAAFYDAGKVFSDRSNLNLEHLEKSIGGGVRFKTPRAVILRLDYARSREGNRAYFKFGPAF